jgi:uncharacterized protein (DUF697 family)
MTNKKKAENILYASVPSAMGAAVIPIPVADVVAITAIQAAMLIGIAKVYGRVIETRTAKALIAAIAASQVGQWIWSGVKIIPGLGTIAGGIGQMALAGSLTALLGYAFVEICENELDFTTEKLKEQAKRAENKAKQVFKEFKDRMKKDKESRKKISFNANPTKFTDQIEFLVNLNNHTSAKIRIINEDGEEIWKHELSSKIDSIVWSPKDLPEGKYFASLHLENLIPLFQLLEKV